MLRKTELALRARTQVHRTTDGRFRNSSQSEMYVLSCQIWCDEMYEQHQRVDSRHVCSLAPRSRHDW